MRLDQLLDVHVLLLGSVQRSGCVLVPARLLDAARILLLLIILAVERLEKGQMLVVATLLRRRFLRLHLDLYFLFVAWTRLSALQREVAVLECLLLDFLLKDERSGILSCLLTAPGSASFRRLGVNFAMLNFGIAFALVGLLAHLLLDQVLHTLGSLCFHFVECFLVAVVGTAEDLVLVGIDRLVVLE